MTSSFPISLIGLPYQFGRSAEPSDYQMAHGPELLLAPDAVPAELSKFYSDIELLMLDHLKDPKTPKGALRPVSPGDQMIRTQFQNNGLAKAVKAAKAQGRFPVCFSGGCNSSIGVVGGLDNPDLGMFWFDAHGDDMTPENTLDGLFEGMPVSIIAGECWKTWRENIEGFHVIPAQRISQIGLHDRSVVKLMPGRRNGVGHLVDPAAIASFGFKEALLRARDEIKVRCDKVYVHVDVDVIDTRIMWGNKHGTEGGLTPEQVVWAVAQIAEVLSIEAINFTSYDTAADPKAPGILIPMVRDLVKAIQTSKTS